MRGVAMLWPAGLALLAASRAADSGSCEPEPLPDAAATLPSTVPSSGAGAPINAWFGALLTIVPELALFEVPPAVRVTSMLDTLTWACITTYHPTWTDAVLHGEAPIAGRGPDDLHTTDARVLCSVHAYATLFPTLLTTSLPGFLGFTEAVGINVTLNAGFPEDATSDLAVCFDAYVEANAPDWDDCARPRRDQKGNFKPIKPSRIPGIQRPVHGLDDLRRCLGEAAACHSYDPSFVGPALARFVHEYFATDGFNANGAIGKDGTECTANCRPFSDYTGYNPVNYPGSKSRRTRWEPLSEDNGDGFFYRQEHVAPHVGFGALPRVLSRRDVDHRRVDKPKYDYEDEAQETLRRLRELTGEQKMLVEFFDNIHNVGIQSVGEVLGQFGPQAPFEVLALYATAFTLAEHDAAIVAWKEKVRQDRVRPTTVIQALDEEVETWAGPGAGVQTIKARDFASYVRVMPHAEFPSSTACQCQAFEEYNDAFLAFTFNHTTSLSWSLSFPAGSSRIEPGVTPAMDVAVNLPNFGRIRDAAGQSRLDGGQHFTLSIAAGEELCEGIGLQVMEFAKGLTNGESALNRL